MKPSTQIAPDKDGGLTHRLGDPWDKPARLSLASEPVMGVTNYDPAVVDEIGKPARQAGDRTYFGIRSVPRRLRHARKKYEEPK